MDKLCAKESARAKMMSREAGLVAGELSEYSLVVDFKVNRARHTSPPNIILIKAHAKFLFLAEWPSIHI